MTDPQVLRIAAAELAEAHGDAGFADGDHQVEAAVSLRLTGSVQQLPLQLVTPTVQIPLAEVLGFVAQKLGVGAERLHGLVMQAAADALAASAEPPMALIMAATDALTVAKQKHQAGRPKQERRGPLRRIVTVSHLRIRGPKA